MTLRKYFKVYSKFLHTSLASELEYKTNILIDLITAILSLIGSIFLLSIFFQNAGSIGGWDFEEALIIQGIYTILNGITNTWFNPNLTEIVKHIREGTLDFVLIKPIDSQFFISLKKINSSSESLTQNNKKFLLNVYVNYGRRQEIVKVAKELALKSSSGEIKPSEVNEELFNSELLTRGIKDPELLIRTSGEKRISNFLLWQLAYSEIYISDVLWPDFNEFEFLKAIIDYQSRNRRFGGIESLPNESFQDSQYSS